MLSGEGLEERCGLLTGGTVAAVGELGDELAVHVAGLLGPAEPVLPEHLLYEPASPDLISAPGPQRVDDLVLGEPWIALPQAHPTSQSGWLHPRSRMPAGQDLGDAVRGRPSASRTRHRVGSGPDRRAATPERDQATPLPPSPTPSSSSASWGPKGSPAPSSLRR